MRGNLLHIYTSEHCVWNNLLNNFCAGTQNIAPEKACCTTQQLIEINTP